MVEFKYRRINNNYIDPIESGDANVHGDTVVDVDAVVCCDTTPQCDTGVHACAIV